ANRDVPPVCDQEMFRFDLQGAPTDEDPVPAFAGAVYFDVGSRNLVDVPLACRDISDVNDPSCLPESTAVETNLWDVAANNFVQSTDVTVFVGEPRENTSVVPPVWNWKGPPDSTAMGLIATSVPPRWRADDVTKFSSFGCVHVTPDIGGAYSTVSCEKNPPIDLVDGHITLSGLALPDVKVRELLQAAVNAGVISVFPATGMVIGRVLAGSASGSGLANVRVTGNPAAAVGYFTEDVDGNIIGVDDTGGAVTRGNGYFLSLDAGFGTRWTAEQVVDMRREDGVYYAGLIANKISIVLIRMGDPP
ncbi:MAG TPA: hypothetical protein VL172_08215, partial [Kofleriaceae bacterium]|nr:hypothetical protein [Kofleriaceae bacterium]